MKVFNLTDVATPQLKAGKLVNHTIVVGTVLLGPGESGDVDDKLVDQLRPEIQKLVKLGVLAADELPAAYKLAKESSPSTAVTSRPPPPMEEAVAAEEAPSWRKTGRS